MSDAKMEDRASDDSDDGQTYFDRSEMIDYLSKIKDGADVEEFSRFRVSTLQRVVDFPDLHSDPEDYPEDFSGTFESRGPQTRLYWNLEHCPIPEGANLLDLRRKITIALHGLGIHGYVHIWTYGGKLSHNEDDLLNAHFLHTPSPQSIGWSIHRQMSVDILGPSGLGTYWHIDRSVFVVLAFPSTELNRVLEYIHSKCQQTLLTIEPQVDLFKSANSVLEHTFFVGGGGKTRPKTYPSRRIMPANVFESGVFWDARDCPFPLGWSPVTIYKEIKFFFTKKYRMSQNLSVSAYVDEINESLREFPELPLIDFIPAGYNPVARHERMLNDILLWMLHHPRGAHLLVAGKINTKMYHVLGSLERGCSIIVIRPTKDTTPEKRGDWPGYLLDEAYTIGLTESRSLEHKDKKLKGFKRKRSLEHKDKSLKLGV